MMDSEKKGQMLPHYREFHNIVYGIQNMVYEKHWPVQIIIIHFVVMDFEFHNKDSEFHNKDSEFHYIYKVSEFLNEIEESHK